MKKFASVIAMLLVCCMALSACGSSTGNASSAASGNETSGGYTYRTSATVKVANENGTFTKENVSAPILLTSVGQSADVSMLNALMAKTGCADFTFNATASADEIGNYGTIILACGASSKGLGAAGISQEDELARAQAIADACKAKDVTVIAAHLGGSARRGTLSDQFTNMALSCADYILAVEDGNEDSLFTDFAAENGIPVTLIYSIADALVPMTELFGA